MAPISLDPNADTSFWVAQRGPVKHKKVEFKVLANALSANSYWGRFLRHMSGASGFKPNDTHIEDTGITVVAVEIVLRGMHQDYHRRKNNIHGPNSSDESSVEGQVNNDESVTANGASSATDGAPGFDAASLANQTPADDGASSSPEIMDVGVYFPHELFKADIDDVWGVTALINLVIAGKKHKGKFDVDRKVVEPWFIKWRETSFKTFSTQADFEKVLFPTFAFNDSEGFLQATKWLCQRTSVGNIAEYNPFVHSHGTQWYLHLHLPPTVICKSPTFSYLLLTYTDGKTAWVRIARSRLRTKVSNEIWSIIRGEDGWLLHSDKCTCWVVAHYNYLKALEKAGVLCPELDHKKSIMELVERMKTVEYDEPLNACIKCSKANITRNLQEAIHVGSTCKGVSIPESMKCDKQERRRKWLQDPPLSRAALAEAMSGMRL